MSIESTTKFFQKAQNNETLMQKLRAISLDNEEGLNAVVALAKETGYDITVEDLKKGTNENAELSPDELENVSGGATRYRLDYTGSNL